MVGLLQLFLEIKGTFMIHKVYIPLYLDIIPFSYEETFLGIVIGN